MSAAASASTSSNVSGEETYPSTTVAPRAVLPSCKLCAHAPVPVDDPLLESLGLCVSCERGHVYERYQQRESTNLLSSLPEDALVHVLLHACSGRGGHRTALRLSRVSVLISTLLRHRLWKHLCVHESGPLAEAGGWRERLDMSKLNRPPWGSWAHLHRGLSVPMRFRSRRYGAWRKTDSRSFNSARSVKNDARASASVLRLDAAAAVAVNPSYGFSVWRDAEPLLSRDGLRLLTGRAPDWPRQPDTPPAILCIARESSTEHVVLSGMIPHLTAEARQAITKLPRAEALIEYPGVSRSSRNERRKRRFQRCLCCARSLVRDGRGGAVADVRCHPLERPPIMLDAEDWFVEDIDRWRANGGCRPTDDGRPPLMMGAQWRDVVDSGSATSYGARASTPVITPVDPSIDPPDASSSVQGSTSAGTPHPSGSAGVVRVSAPLMRTTHLTGSGHHSEAVELEAWPVLDSDEAEPECYAALERALVCPKGHVVLVYELEPYESDEEDAEDGSDETEESEEEETDFDDDESLGESLFEGDGVESWDDGDDDDGEEDSDEEEEGDDETDATDWDDGEEAVAERALRAAARSERQWRQAVANLEAVQEAAFDY